MRNQTRELITLAFAEADDGESVEVFAGVWLMSRASIQEEARQAEQDQTRYNAAPYWLVSNDGQQVSTDPQELAQAVSNGLEFIYQPMTRGEVPLP